MFHGRSKDDGRETRRMHRGTDEGDEVPKRDGREGTDQLRSAVSWTGDAGNRTRTRTEHIRHRVVP